MPRVKEHTGLREADQEKLKGGQKRLPAAPSKIMKSKKEEIQWLKEAYTQI